jgi:serine protease Do
VFLRFKLETVTIVSFPRIVITMLKQVGIMLVLGAGAFLGSVAATFLQERANGIVVAQSPPATSGDTLNRLSERFEWVANKVGPAVVAIEAVKPPAPGKARGVEESGSGVIIQGEQRKDCYVLTNNHVVAGAKPEQITITLADNRVVRPVQVWADPESDVALLRVERGDLPTARLGDSDQVRVGQWVVAIGSPFGLNQSVTHGIISARERGQISLGGNIRIKNFLQTDAPINPGSSGGPLLNLDGEVIGINTASASYNNSNSGVAFSIPINLVRRVARELLEKGTVSRGFLGLYLAPTFEPATALRLGLEHANGALVETVYPQTPAEEAGLKPGDVILRLDNTLIRNENQLINAISSMPVGRRVRLEVWRDRQLVTLHATIGNWQEAQSRLRTISAKPT